jgi:Plasmid pRiA4b ORF-3-like protein
LTTKTAQIYQVHVLLHDVEPAVWRRLPVCADATLADLHAIVQIAFGWRDDRRHYFVIRGKTYGDRNAGPESAALATFGFRPKERFKYEIGGRWRHQIRFEEANGLAAPHPVCLAGARVAPAEDRSMRSDGADDCERVEPLSTDWLCLYEGSERSQGLDRTSSASRCSRILIRRVTRAAAVRATNVMFGLPLFSSSHRLTALMYVSVHAP